MDTELVIVRVCLLNHLSHVLLFCGSLDYSPPGSSVHGILQARILEWVAVLFSRATSNLTAFPFPQIIWNLSKKSFSEINIQVMIQATKSLKHASFQMHSHKDKPKLFSFCVVLVETNSFTSLAIVFSWGKTIPEVLRQF